MLESADQRGIPPEFVTSLSRLKSGKWAAEATINGKTLKTEGDTDRDASLALEQAIQEAALKGEVNLQ